MHLPFILGHHVAKHAVLAHVAHKFGATSAGHAVGHAAARHGVVTVGAAAGKAAVTTKVAAHGTVAKGLASGAAAKTATVHAAHGAVTPVGHVAAASGAQAVIPLKHVAKKAIVRVASFRPVVPPAPPVS